MQQTGATLGAGQITPTARFGYIPGLDGIRAFAVMVVLIAHLGFGHIIPGGFGVTVFFFISGFLITRLLIAEGSKDDGINLPRFYIRRFLRLLPALYVMLVVTTLIMLAMGDVPKLWESVAAVTYTMNYHYAVLAFTGEARVAPWEHLWSLAVEEHFYLLFPLLLVAFRQRLKTALYVCLALCAVALAWRVTTIHALGFPPLYNYAATETRMDSILWGCALSLALHVYGDRSFWKHLVGPIALGLATIVLLYCFIERSTDFRQTFRYTLQGAALAVCVLNLMFWTRLRILVTALEWAPIAWIGRVSYGLYLWHMPALMFASAYMGFETGSPAYLIAGTVLSFAFTTASYYGVERPLMGLRRRFGSHVSAGPERVTLTTAESSAT